MTDRLGVLSSCRAVAATSTHVRIDEDAILRIAQELKTSPEPPGWDADLHYRATGENGDEHTAMWLMVLDALNFCFWGQGEDSADRWRVQWKGNLVDGYVALVAALTQAVEHGYPLHDPFWLAEVSAADVGSMLAPAEGHTEIPLLDNRIENLRELGQGLLPLGPGPATAFIQTAEHSAINLVQNIVEIFPSFKDDTVWPYAETGLANNEVRLYKRAQILAGDIAGGLAGSPLARFDDLDQLTAFADYKVPQILREMGALVYDDALTSTIDSRIRIPAGSRMEVEIRAATIVACDRLVTTLCSMGRPIIAAELDWQLWSLSQSLPTTSRPYHLTPTIYY